MAITAKIIRNELIYNGTMQKIYIEENAEYLDTINFLLEDLTAINGMIGIRILEVYLSDDNGIVYVIVIGGRSIKILSGERGVIRKVSGWIIVNYEEKKEA